MSEQQYSDERLLKILKDYYIEHGRPTQKMFDADKTLPSSVLYATRFGGMRKALVLLELIKDDGILKFNEMSDEDILDNVKTLYKNNGKITSADFTRKNNLPSSNFMLTRFGSLKKVYDLCDIPYDDMHFSKNKNITDEKMLKMLKDYIDEHGIPTSKTFTAKNGYASNEMYRKKFGSWFNAIKLCGATIPEDRLKYYQNDRLTDKELLQKLRENTAIHLETNRFLVSGVEFSKYTDMQTFGVYCDRFGGIKETYGLIGYDYEEFNNQALEERMMEKLLELNDILGASPTTANLNYYSQYYEGFYSASAYDHHFGSISLALRKAGLELCRASITRGKTDEELLDVLKQIHVETGKYPDQIILNTSNDYPGYSTYVKKFGSWENAMFLAFGRKITQLAFTRITPNGNKCRSLLQYIYACMLEKYEIKYEIDEIYYRDYIPGLKRRYRFDFLVKIGNKAHLIEIFGLVGFKDYNNKTKIKMDLCKTNDVPLIDLYPKDIQKKTQKELYEDLIDRIKTLDSFNAAI